MTDYIKWDDVVDRFPEVARIGGADEVSSSHIQYAERELEGYLAGYFTTPFSSNNLTAKDLAVDLTYLRVSKLKGKDRKEFRDEVMSRIDMLRDGQMAMMTSSGDTLQSVGGTVYSNTEDYHPVFGMGDTLDFAVDSGQIDDEDNERA